MPRQFRRSPGHRAFGRIMAFLIGSGLPAGDNYMLTTTGRQTGLPRSIPVTPVTVGGRRWLVSPYGEVGWVQNVRASGLGKLTRAGK